MTTDLPTALNILAHHRTYNLRKSQESFDAGLLVLNKNALSKLGDDSWSFLEQLALAAIDLGRLDVADDCIQRLTAKFPGSPRVEAVTGIRLEASEPLDVASKYYEDVLQADPTNVVAWKRYITVLRRMGKIEEAVKELHTFLDTFYTDVEGWLELADIYSSKNQNAHSLQSITHAMLLVPQNPFYIVQAAETAYAAGDVPLSARLFLQAIDLVDEDTRKKTASACSPPAGASGRAWYGLRVCTNRMLKDTKATASPTKTTGLSHLKTLASLADERLAAVDAEEFQKMQSEMSSDWVEEAQKWH